MRKFVLALACLIAPFVFSSCEDSGDLLGAIDMTIGSESVSIPNAVFTEVSGTTRVVGTNVKQTVTISFKGTGEKTYTLGLGKDLLSAAGNIGNITNMENTLLYVPSSGITEDGLTAICGTLTVTKYTNTGVEGTFKGKGLKTRLITSGNIDFSSLEGALQDFEGTFTAIGKK